jgi:hypothetical protein
VWEILNYQLQQVSYNGREQAHAGSVQFELHENLLFYLLFGKSKVMAITATAIFRINLAVVLATLDMF